MKLMTNMNIFFSSLLNKISLDSYNISKLATRRDNKAINLDGITTYSSGSIVNFLERLLAILECFLNCTRSIQYDTIL